MEGQKTKRQVSYQQAPGEKQEYVKWLLLAFFIIALLGVIFGRFANHPVATQSGTSLPSFTDIVSSPPQQDLSTIPAPGQIDAISWSEDGDRLVMLDGEVFREGDVFKGFKIYKICKDKVEYEKDGKIWEHTVSKQYEPTYPNTHNSYQHEDYTKQTRYKNNSYKEYRQPTYNRFPIAENESYYGQISENTGRPKTVYVRGYYRKDGTYVRSHYRSPPRR